ncbi:acyltransferase [Rhodopirellula sp. ICT_H3.1]|uniref:Acyltransferase n=2 Tax=Aporhodopirellula aestuarii TaxID=2950107 RepID=A0ABT0U6D6_9BACT|nr:acyltransferase [Aporhodopirellula aestuarii]
MPKILPMTTAANRPSSVSSEPHRNHFAGIDALRAVAAVAVVVLHACVPYAQPSMAGLSWSVHDTPSEPVTAVFWAIEIVIMPIFLVIAGFFAARSIAYKGAWSTAANRLRRLGWPLLLTTLFLLPIEFYTWMLGWVAEGQVAVGNVRRMKFEGGIDRNLWGLSHLWFLQYLMTYMILLAASWSTLVRCTAGQIGRIALPGCFLAAVVALTLRPEVVWGFQHSFLPVVSKWVYSGAFFAAGVFWYRLDPELDELAERGSRLLGPGVLLTTAAVCIGTWWLGVIGDPAMWIGGGWAGIDPEVTTEKFAGQLPASSLVMRSALAILSVGAASLITFALMGISLASVNRLSPIMKSLANASFLIYLLHHPVVGLAHIAAKFALPTVSPIAKVALVSSLGVAAGWSVSWLATRRRQRIREQSQASQERPQSIAFPQRSETEVAKTRAA